ncbi:MAG TPA: hypothetical protein VGL82_08970 [Bryobacteraceae bacterium]|jgi:hypothetical protein
MALSFAKDIKPLFNAVDQDHMLNQQGMFDLWDYNDVKTNADQILNAVKAGKMPPKRDGGPWPKDKVQKFQDWISQDYPQ